MQIDDKELQEIKESATWLRSVEKTGVIDAKAVADSLDNLLSTIEGLKGDYEAAVISLNAWKEHAEGLKGEVERQYQDIIRLGKRENQLIMQKVELQQEMDELRQEVEIYRTALERISYGNIQGGYLSIARKALEVSHETL